MKKSLVLFMALVLVVSFAFADEVGRATLGTDKGVITAGDPLNVSFSLTLEDVDEDVTTIEVMGDEVADNVFVMLIKDLPNEDATYEAQKVVDPDAQKTTYYIKAKELVGTLGIVHAELVDWKGVVVDSAEEEFAWKGTTVAKNLQLVPGVEGLYTVNAYIEFADGTRMELKGWNGHAQLVALDRYLKETVPGLAAELDAANSISVSAGMEFMTSLSVNEEGQSIEPSADAFLGVYGEGARVVPSLVWNWTEPDQPEFDKVELVYVVHGAVDDPSNFNALDRVDEAYIKFLVMQETFAEGDCCADPKDVKWALWFAVGTGEYTDIYGYRFLQEFSFHNLYQRISASSSIVLSKGEQCRGWLKAIFYLDPSDIKIWVETILGTDWVLDQPGYYNDYQDGQFGPVTSGSYSGNMLDYAELNFIGRLQFKDVVNLRGGLLGIPLGSKLDKNASLTWYAEADLLLEADSGISLEIGGFVGDINAFAPRRTARYYNVYDANGNLIDTDFAGWDYFLAPVNQKIWKAHILLSGLDFTIPMFPNTVLTDAINNIRFGAFLNGDWADGFKLTTIDLALCMESDLICCYPVFKVGVGLDVDVAEGEFNLGKVFAEYNHEIGEYGPVTLDGKLGVIYTLGDNPIDVAWWNGGEYGQELYPDTDYFGAALGVAYEVTGTIEW